ncbi:MAG: alpha-ribazole phosphatase [Leptospira sp.]|nr:alpha-ribazole phosphatase [Leptospira sp.]
MEIFLIRHTKVDIAEGTCYGFSDIGLAGSFEEELKFLKSKFPERKEIKFYSSPLRRCAILAGELSNQREIIYDRRLMELNFGNWELQKWDEISKKEIHPWTRDFVNEKPPGGESYAELFKRSTEAFDEILRKNEEKIAIVAHGGIIRSLFSHILSIPLEKSFHLQIDYGSVSKIKSAPRKISVEYINR